MNILKAIVDVEENSLVTHKMEEGLFTKLKGAKVADDLKAKLESITRAANKTGQDVLRAKNAVSMAASLEENS